MTSNINTHQIEKALGRGYLLLEDGKVKAAQQFFQHAVKLIEDEMLEARSTWTCVALQAMLAAAKAALEVARTGAKRAKDIDWYVK